ncbi:MAG: F0F1 ATP synthase subunit delta [Actinomycetota bacterium]
MATPLELVSQRVEEVLAQSGDAVQRVADEAPAFAGLLRRERRLRAALTEISVGTEGKRELLRSLFADRVAPQTLEAIGALLGPLLDPDQLERAAADLAVRAILAAAEQNGSLEDVEDELFRFSRIIDSTPSLRAALTDPRFGPDARTAVVGDLLAGRARPETARLAAFVVGTGLERDPGRALEELAELAAARRGRVVVEARTAVPIDVHRQARLEEALTRAVGRRVDLEVVVDPDVVGGVVARVGDEIIDGSVRRKLQLALDELTT